jgi:hypothetical protein
MVFIVSSGTSQSFASNATHFQLPTGNAGFRQVLRQVLRQVSAAQLSVISFECGKLSGKLSGKFS